MNIQAGGREGREGEREGGREEIFTYHILYFCPQIPVTMLESTGKL